MNSVISFTALTALIALFIEVQALVKSSFFLAHITSPMSGVLLASSFDSTLLGAIMMQLSIFGAVVSLVFISLHNQNKQEQAFKVILFYLAKQL